MTQVPQEYHYISFASPASLSMSMTWNGFPLMQESGPGGQQFIEMVDLYLVGEEKVLLNFELQSVAPITMVFRRYAQGMPVSGKTGIDIPTRFVPHPDVRIDQKVSGEWEIVPRISKFQLAFGARTTGRDFSATFSASGPQLPIDRSVDFAMKLNAAFCAGEVGRVVRAMRAKLEDQALIRGVSLSDIGAMASDEISAALDRGPIPLDPTEIRTQPLLNGTMVHVFRKGGEPLMYTGEQDGIKSEFPVFVGVRRNEVNVIR